MNSTVVYTSPQSGGDLISANTYINPERPLLVQKQVRRPVFWRSKTNGFQTKFVSKNNWTSKKCRTAKNSRIAFLSFSPRELALQNSELTRRFIYVQAPTGTFCHPSTLYQLPTSEFHQIEILQRRHSNYNMIKKDYPVKGCDFVSLLIIYINKKELHSLLEENLF